MMHRFIKSCAGLVSEGRVKFWEHKEILLRRRIRDMRRMLVEKFNGREQLWFEVNRLRIMASGEEWEICKRSNARKFRYLFGEDRSRREEFHFGQRREMLAKSDSFLEEKFGKLQTAPLVYGGVQLSEEESKAL